MPNTPPAISFSGIVDLIHFAQLASQFPDDHPIGIRISLREIFDGKGDVLGGFMLRSTTNTCFGLQAVIVVWASFRVWQVFRWQADQSSAP